MQTQYMVFLKKVQKKFENDVDIWETTGPDVDWDIFVDGTKVNFIFSRFFINRKKS